MPRTGCPAFACAVIAPARPVSRNQIEIGDGRLAARKHHKIGVGDLGRRCRDPDDDAGLGRERFEIGGVREVRQAYGGHAQPLVADGRRRPSEDPAVRIGQRILRVDPQIRTPRHDAEGGPAGRLFQQCEPGFEQAGVAPKLVDHEPGDERLVGPIEQRQRAVQCREHAAAIDVSGHDHRHLAMAGQTHVHVVARPQVDLGRAAGALGDDDVIVGAEIVEGPIGGHAEARAPVAGEEVAGTDVADRLAAQDHLTTHVAAGLEQHRIERDARGEPACRRLHRLRPPDFAADAVGVEHHDRVVRHVLCLERSHANTLAMKPSTDAGHDRRLAGVRRRARDEERAAHAVGLLTARRAATTPALTTRANAPTVWEIRAARRISAGPGSGPRPSIGRTSTRPW